MEENVKNAQDEMTNEDRAKIEARPENDFLRVTTALVETTLLPLIEGSKKGIILIAHDPETTNENGEKGGATIVAAAGAKTSLIQGIYNLITNEGTEDFAVAAMARVEAEYSMKKAEQVFKELFKDEGEKPEEGEGTATEGENQPGTEQGKEG